MRVRRVGSVTCGCLLILFGGLFIIHMFVPALSYSVIYKFWPVILIALGGEMLFANLKKKGSYEIKYDFAATFLVIILAFFAMGMGIADYVMK